MCAKCAEITAVQIFLPHICLYLCCSSGQQPQQDALAYSNSLERKPSNITGNLTQIPDGSTFKEIEKTPLTCKVVSLTRYSVPRVFSISFPEPAIPWEGNGGSGLIRDRQTKNCMSPVLRMRCK